MQLPPARRKRRRRSPRPTAAPWTAPTPPADITKRRGSKGFPSHADNNLKNNENDVPVRRRAASLSMPASAGIFIARAALASQRQYEIRGIQDAVAQQRPKRDPTSLR